jgi:hypothetical protein
MKKKNDLGVAKKEKKYRQQMVVSKGSEIYYR